MSVADPRSSVGDLEKYCCRDAKLGHWSRRLCHPVRGSLRLLGSSGDSKLLFHTTMPERRKPRWDVSTVESQLGRSRQIQGSAWVGRLEPVLAGRRCQHCRRHRIHRAWIRSKAICLYLLSVGRRSILAVGVVDASDDGRGVDDAAVVDADDVNGTGS